MASYKKITESTDRTEAEQIEHALKHPNALTLTTATQHRDVSFNNLFNAFRTGQLDLKDENGKSIAFDPNDETFRRLTQTVLGHRPEKHRIEFVGDVSGSSPKPAKTPVAAVPPSRTSRPAPVAPPPLLSGIPALNILSRGTPEPASPSSTARKPSRPADTRLKGILGFLLNLLGLEDNIPSGSSSTLGLARQPSADTSRNVPGTEPAMIGKPAGATMPTKPLTPTLTNKPLIPQQPTNVRQGTTKSK